MSYVKRYMDDLYYDKVRNRMEEELIEEGIDPEDIKVLIDIFETEEEG